MIFDQYWVDFESGITVCIEADENAAYAYLSMSINGKIKSMVWLYNTSDPPDVPDWVTRINYGRPCRNPSEFITHSLILPSDPPNDLLVVLNLRAPVFPQIEIGVIAPDENSVQLLAILQENQEIGWCSNASSDSKAAKSIGSALLLGITPCRFWENETDNDRDYRIFEMAYYSD